MGLPWECVGKSVASFWHTAKRIVFEPQIAFKQMRREGLAAPLSFAVCGVLCASLIFICLLFLFSLFSFSVPGAANLDVGAVFHTLCACGLMVGGAVICMLIGTLVTGSLIHFLLSRFRGSNYSFVTTLSVVGYVGGVMFLLGAIPCLGFQFATGGFAIYAIIGLSAAHGTTKGKTTVAVLLPLAFLLFLLFIGGCLCTVASLTRF
jgi:hypothetical protein